MRKTKDSGIDWIGKIPEEWVIIPVNYVTTSRSGGTPDRNNLDYWENGSIPWMASGEVNKVLVYETNEKITELATKVSSAKIVPANSVMVALNGQGKTKGMSAVLKIDAACNQSLCAFQCNSRKLHYMYLFYCFQSMYQYLRFQAGDDVRDGLAASFVKKQRVPLPLLDEQKKIADFLDGKCADIDQIRADIEKQIEILTDYKKSVITEAVTKGFDPKAKLKDSGIEWIGKIPEGWGVKRFKYIADALYKGNGITKEQVFLDGNTQCVRYGEIYSKYNISFSDCLSLTKCELISSPQYFEYGDILFAGTGELVEEIGKNIVYLGNEKCLAGGDIVVARHSQNPSFLNYALGSSYCQSQKSSGKAKLKVVHISATQIGNILVAIPPLSEQEAIADYLDEKCSAIDATIADKQKQLETLDEYKKSLIFEYVTGKKEVPA